MENGPVPYCQICNDLIEQAILILVVVENGLVRRMYHFCILWNLGLNPCCSGRWSRTECFKMFRHLLNSLNPCCSGRWTRTFRTLLEFVMEKSVLILVVVEDGLVQLDYGNNRSSLISLNPCCSGRWSRTRPYKTLLIINKLKNFTKQILTFVNRK